MNLKQNNNKLDELIKKKKQNLDVVFNLLQNKSDFDLIWDEEKFIRLLDNLYYPIEGVPYKEVWIRRYDDRDTRDVEFTGFVNVWRRFKNFLADRNGRQELINDSLDVWVSLIEPKIHEDDIKEIKMKTFFSDMCDKTFTPERFNKIWHAAFTSMEYDLGAIDGILVTQYTMKSAFMNLINGIKISDFTFCKNSRCRNVFVKVTKHERAYCHKLCGSKAYQNALSTAKEGTALHKQYLEKKRSQRRKKNEPKQKFELQKKATTSQLF